MTISSQAAPPSMEAILRGVLIMMGSLSQWTSAARAAHVPTIVGLGDLSARVGEGEVLTVDADDDGHRDFDRTPHFAGHPGFMERGDHDDHGR